MGGVLDSCLRSAARITDTAVSRLADVLQTLAPPDAPRHKVRVANGTGQQMQTTSSTAQQGLVRVSAVAHQPNCPAHSDVAGCAVYMLCMQIEVSVKGALVLLLLGLLKGVISVSITM